MDKKKARLPLVRDGPLKSRDTMDQATQYSTMEEYTLADSTRVPEEL